MSAKLFYLWCNRFNLNWHTAGELDALLADYLVHMFKECESRAEANYVVAAVKYFTSVTLMPLSARALKGWTRLAPSSQRLPVPLVVAAAICWKMVQATDPMMAVATLLTFLCYLRPSETLRLRGRHLVKPSEAAGSQFTSWGLNLADSTLNAPRKTGLYDEAVAIDRPCALNWPVLAVIKERILDADPIWPFTYAKRAAVFNSACNALHLEAFRPHLYSLRHGGASEDRLRNHRALNEVKFRGRWASDQSVKRYTKATHLQSVMQRVPLATLLLGQRVLKDFPSALQSQLQR